MVSPQLIGIVIVHSLWDSTDDIVPIVVDTVRTSKCNGGTKKQLQVDKVSQLIAGNEAVCIARPSCTGYTTHTVNKQLGSEKKNTFLGEFKELG
jgi:hypothetical protein